MHLSAEECPHCGLTLDQLDAVYAGFDRNVRRPHDAAGVLRVQDRKLVAKWIRKAEKSFPQLYFCLVTTSLSDEQQIRSYGYWLMNRGVFEDLPDGVREDGGVMIVIDVNRKEVCLHLGYLLDAYLKEDEAFDALAGAHPHLLEAKYVPAIEALLNGTKRYTKRLLKRAKKEAKKAQ